MFARRLACILVSQKVWGGRARCWLAHMALNATTWGDPSRVKLRAARGLSAADYFGFNMDSLFLWGKIIRELAVLGYDDSSLHMASYDW